MFQRPRNHKWSPQSVVSCSGTLLSRACSTKHRGAQVARSPERYSASSPAVGSNCKHVTQDWVVASIRPIVATLFSIYPGLIPAHSLSPHAVHQPLGTARSVESVILRPCTLTCCNHVAGKGARSDTGEGMKIGWVGETSRQTKTPTIRVTVTSVSVPLGK